MKRALAIICLLAASASAQEWAWPVLARQASKRGVPGVLPPWALPSCVSWVDGTTLTDGQTVTNWTTRGGAISATPYNVNNLPVATNGPDGVMSVFFNGTTNGLALIAARVPITNAGSAYAVAAFRTVQNDVRAGALWDLGNGNKNNSIGIGGNFGWVDEPFIAERPALAAAAALTGGVWNVVSIVHTNGGWVSSANGKTGASGRGALDPRANLLFGCCVMQTTPQPQYLGNIYAVGVFAPAPSVSDRQAIEAYLRKAVGNE